MAITLRLDLRQSQTLVMTPQLQQAIKLLQLSNEELATYIERELEQNPMLEREDQDRPEDGDGSTKAGEGDDLALQGEAAAEDEDFESFPPDSMDYADKEIAPDLGDSLLDADYENLWSSNSVQDGEEMTAAAFSGWGSGGRSDFSNPTPDIEQTVSSEPSLRDHLLSQLNVDVPDPAERVIGLHLIDMLDGAGYFSGDLHAVAQVLGCDVEWVEKTLEKLRRFDPPGIFARDLADCLSLQLGDRNRLDPAMQTLMENLDLLAKHSYGALMRLCGVDAEDLTEMIAEIRALNPKPALAFDHNLGQPITPDIFMRPSPKGGWIIELNQDNLPKVLVNNAYYTEICGNSRSKKERDFITECFNSANWLVKSLHQRAKTILKVATEIVRQQEAFFSRGVQYLKPLILRDIAEVINMHQSTVSRVTANKYIATPRGNYELKYFFTSALAGSSGDELYSSESVRDRIKTLIDNETPKEILSDHRIVAILKSEGVDIARRTVAKYREGMRIPSSIQRRREKSSTWS